MPTPELVERVARRLDPKAWLPIDGKAPDTEEMFGRREASCDNARVAIEAYEGWLEEKFNLSFEELKKLKGGDLAIIRRDRMLRGLIDLAALQKAEHDRLAREEMAEESSRQDSGKHDQN